MYFNLFYKNLNNRVLPNSEFPNYQICKVQLSQKYAEDYGGLFLNQKP